MHTRIEAAAGLFAALSHPARLHIVALLTESSPQTASELQAQVGLERTSLSHQLRVLRDARLVKRTRDGRTQRYELADHHVAHIVTDAIKHVSEVS